MASPAASLAALGSNPSLTVLEQAIPYTSINNIGRRVHVISRISFGNFSRSSRCPPRICKCMVVTANTVEEKGIIPSSLQDTVSSSSNSSNGNGGLVLKRPAPKPVLERRPNSRTDPFINEKRPVLTKVVDDRDDMIESLGEALEKAEKLETATPTPIKLDEGKANDSRIAKAKAKATPGVLKSKTLKSVWRKGNPVTKVQRVVTEVPKIKEGNAEGRKATEKSEAPSVVTATRPQMLSRPKATHMLQAKPSVAPPPIAASPAMPQPAVKKPIVAKERKGPVLVDKFASKKGTADTTAFSKTREELQRRKQPNAFGGFLKRSGAKDREGPRKGKKWTKASRRAAKLEAELADAPVRVEILEVGEEGMSTVDLAYELAVDELDVLHCLTGKGIFAATTAHILDKGMVKIVCDEYGVEVLEIDPIKVEDMAKKKNVIDEEDSNMLEERPPVITIMGHVDHGKTTLLDYIRKTKVAASEAGGITQAIGAYKVLVPVDGKIQPCVFLDTPGHEAFGAMRARGARVTDIAIIVVAADDGVRPQTNEAIAHAKAAGVPIVIAINKVDKDGASPDRVMQELSSVGLMPESWGGDVPVVQISALKGENVDELLETVMLVAEMQELKANPHRSAKGTVIEARLDKAKGPVATVIVQNGTLRKGDVVVCGAAAGKMRALFDDRGDRVDAAGPSMAVQVIGLSDVPIAGDEFEVVDSLDVARERAEACAQALQAARAAAKAGEAKLTLSSIASAVARGNRSGLDRHQLNIILKVDVQGSIEAIRHALRVLPQDNVTVKYLLQAPGDVSASDVDLAVVAKAIIFGFNVKVPGSIKSYADRSNVEIRLYNVIYDLINDMRNTMEGLLEPVEERIPIGAAKVLAVFRYGSGRVAGCMVTEGKVVKECGVRVVRRGRTIHTGRLDSLRRVKEDVKEVGAGLECGMGVNNFMYWEAGDVIEAFNIVKKKRTLEEASAAVTAALAKAGYGK